jgi:DNA-binding Lrp family transcriptional regulator
MLAIVRVKIMDDNDSLWEYVLENKETIEKEFNGQAQLMYITKRARHEDTSLFISAENPDILGNFLAKKVSKIEGVDKIWMINLMGMKFFKIPEEKLMEMQRAVVTIRAYPNKFDEIYNGLSKFQPFGDFIPVYVAYTFHYYGDSLMFSLVANDIKGIQGYIEENIKEIPGVFGYTTDFIEKQQRLASKEVWKGYVKENLLPY